MKLMKKCLCMIVLCLSLLLQMDIVYAGQINSNFNVSQGIVIMCHPTSQTYVAGQKVTAKVVAEGSGLKYQWQYKMPNDRDWNKWSGAGNTTAETTYSFPAAFNGIKLRCVVTDVTGNSAVSNEATYTLGAELKITGHPTSQTYVAGQKVTAKVVAEGSGLKYQWQYKMPNDRDWNKWSGAGNTTAETTYSFPATFNGIKLRCVITDITGKTIISDSASYFLINGEDWELPIM